MKTKAQKQEILKSLKEQVASQKAMLFVDCKGIKVKDLLALRRQLKQAKAKLQVVKKTLFQKALLHEGINVDVKQLQGEMAAIFAPGDPSEPARIAFQFAKTNEHVKILGGYFDRQFAGAPVLQEIANLPSRQQLLSQLAGTLAAPLSGFMNVLEGNIKGLIRVISNVKTYG